MLLRKSNNVSLERLTYECMLLIDRYLLRTFLWVWFICFCSLTGLYIVIDALTNLEEFLRIAERTQQNFLVVMGDFYLYRAIAFFDRTSGILTLIAAMFTLAGLQRYNELTAILAAGVSKWRIVRPIVVAGACIALLAALNRELIMPAQRAKLTRTPQELSSDKAKDFQRREDRWSGISLHGRQLALETQTILEPNFKIPRYLPDPRSTWTAQKANYEPATGDRPGGYRLRGVVTPKNVAEEPPLLQAEGQIAIHTPQSAPWLAADECFVVSEVNFELLVDQNGWRQYASTSELIAALHKQGVGCGNDVRTTVHARLLQPLLDVVLLLLGLPLVLRGLNRNLFIAVGQCVLVVVIFLLVLVTSQYLGGSYLVAPVVAAWIPLLFFVPATVFNAEPLWE